MLKYHTGYLLTHITPISTFTQLIHRLSQYAEWCRASSAVLNVNTPTVVQMLFDSPSSLNTQYGRGLGLGRFSLASSVSAGKGEGREAVRETRIQTLEAVWPHPLLYPTPVQRVHASAGVGFQRDGLEPTAELFGTPWGHCGEGITFPS